MVNTEKKIVQWIKEKVKQSNSKGAVFGLSGGIDSAVVAALVKKAVGDNHLAVMMPCHSVKKAKVDAQLVIEQFNLKSTLMDITKSFDSLIKILPNAENRLALANIKPRLRMTVLYYFANNLNYLVIGTGNKSELMCGYFTKYGDGGVDILPIGDLLKFQVRDLAKNLGVPEQIIDKSPSADLWPGQTDEEEMDITYRELDSILLDLTSGKQTGLPKVKINKVIKMQKFSQHKREVPEILKLG